MDRKKILIITKGFYPDQDPRAFRATELAKEFCRQGHIVCVMAPYKNGIEELVEKYGFRYVSLGSLNWRILNLKSYGVIGRLYNKLINRVLPLFLEYPNIELFFKVRKALEQERDLYDLLISVAVPYPIHWGVAAIWKSEGNNIAEKWVADCGDPYCLQENDTFQPPFYFRLVEKWFMRKADYISVPTTNSFKGYFPEFHSKMRVIPQGFRFDDIDVKSITEDGVVRFGYGGVFIPGKRDPREFISFLATLPESYKYEFHVFTRTPQFVLPYVGNEKRIIVHDPIKREELLAVLSSFQFVVNFANQGTAQTPSKLIDYAIISRPILSIETGNLNTEVVKEFLQGDYSNGLRIDNINSFRIENVVQSFLKLI